eukprot:GFYU01007234.1.p1 GENE.GFYU01007234.1~~GFYU01007234.1.p1  ORF type:complete len:214 (-),score=35.08 GFYU01007234.1:275-916(-)
MTQGEAERQWVCGCEKVKVNLRGEPWFHIECYCDDCHSAVQFVMDKQIEGSLDKWIHGNGGLGVASFFAKNVEFISGQEYIQPFRLTEKAVTTRFYTKCCGTLMYGLPDIPGGINPWYTNGLRGKPLPPLKARVFTRCCHVHAVDVNAIPKDSVPTVPFINPLIGKMATLACCGCFYPGRGSNPNMQMGRDEYHGSKIEIVGVNPDPARMERE